MVKLDIAGKEGCLHCGHVKEHHESRIEVVFACGKGLPITWGRVEKGCPEWKKKDDKN